MEDFLAHFANRPAASLADLFARFDNLSPVLMPSGGAAEINRGARSALNEEQRLEGQRADLQRILREAWEASVKEDRWSLMGSLTQLRSRFVEAVDRTRIFSQQRHGVEYSQPRKLREDSGRIVREIQSVKKIDPKASLAPCLGFNTVLDHVLKLGTASRLRICSNGECNTRYFVAGRRSQRFCSELCAGTSIRESKRRWWQENGDNWREQRKGRGRGKRKSK
jgi:hypothetical protein